MRPNDSSKVWRKAGRNGREGSQPLTPRIRRAVIMAAGMHVLYQLETRPTVTGARDGAS